MAADKVFPGFKFQTVAALDTPGKKGRTVVLASNGHLYHDNGTSWDDITENPDLADRIRDLETAAGPKNFLAPRRAAFMSLIGKKQIFSS